MTHAILNIRDILYEQGAIEIDGNILDAVVNVTVVHHGTDDLEIESFEVLDNMVYLEPGEDNKDMVTLNFNAAEGTAVGSLMTKLQYELERLALEIARNTPEYEWSYRLDISSY
jgi:hypothetical protein